MKLWQKGLVGCAIGCGVLLVVAGIAVFAGMYWAVAPGEQIATEQIVGEDSLGALHLDPVREDPGARAFVNTVLAEIGMAQRRQEREQLPESLRWVQDLDAAQGATGLGWLVPKDITMILERIEHDPEPHAVVAINLATFPRMFRWALTRAGKSQTRTSGASASASASASAGAAASGLDARIQPMGGSHFAFVGSTLLLSDEVGALARALARIDRVAASRAEAGSLPSAGGTVALLTPEAGERFDLYGTFVNSDGYLEALLEEELAERSANAKSASLTSASEPLAGVGEATAEGAAAEAANGRADGIEWIQLGVDFRSQDEASLEVEIRCADDDAALYWQGRLEELARAALEDYRARWGLEAEIQGHRAGRLATLKVELRDLEAAIRSVVGSTLEPEPAAPAEPEDAELEE